MSADAEEMCKHRHRPARIIQNPTTGSRLKFPFLFYYYAVHMIKTETNHFVCVSQQHKFVARNPNYSYFHVVFGCTFRHFHRVVRRTENL